MALYLTAYNSSRVRKPGAKASPSRRSSSSPFSVLPRRKPNQRITTVDEGTGISSDGAFEKLDDTGRVTSLATVSPVDGVIQAVRHSHETTFCDIPERTGMNSTRIAEVLNFRKGLPAIVSLAHVHGLITASTRMEREIASLIASGEIRKLSVSGRGNEISGLSEFLVFTQNLEALVRNSQLGSSITGTYFTTVSFVVS
jgi:Serine-threonine protein kinase 19